MIRQECLSPSPGEHSHPKVWQQQWGQRGQWPERRAEKERTSSRLSLYLSSTFLSWKFLQVTEGSQSNETIRGKGSVLPPEKLGWSSCGASSSHFGAAVTSGQKRLLSRRKPLRGRTAARVSKRGPHHLPIVGSPKTPSTCIVLTFTSNSYSLFRYVQPRSIFHDL